MKNKDKKTLLILILILFILLIFSAVLMYDLGYTIGKKDANVFPSYIPYNSTDIVITKVEV